MRVYLSVPMIANRALGRARLLAKAIEDSGHVVASPWVLGDLERHPAGGVDVFERDVHGAEGCDALVADVSEPSIGVGMEVMAAHSAGRRVILIVKKGRATSRMLMQMSQKEILEYDEDGELYGLLSGVLGRWGQKEAVKTGPQDASALKSEVRSKSAPAPAGPYSQAIDSGAVYCSGQLGTDPSNGELEEGIVAQTARAIGNLEAVLNASGLALDNVVKTTVFLADLSEYPAMNEEYSRHFGRPYPARTTVQAAGLPRGAKVEIDAVATR